MLLNYFLEILKRSHRSSQDASKLLYDILIVFACFEMLLIVSYSIAVVRTLERLNYSSKP